MSSELIGISLTVLNSVVSDPIIYPIKAKYNKPNVPTNGDNIIDRKNNSVIIANNPLRTKIAKTDLAYFLDKIIWNIVYKNASLKLNRSSTEYLQYINITAENTYNPINDNITPINAILKRIIVKITDSPTSICPINTGIKTYIKAEGNKVINKIPKPINPVTVKLYNESISGGFTNRPFLILSLAIVIV